MDFTSPDTSFISTSLKFNVSSSIVHLHRHESTKHRVRVLLCCYVQSCPLLGIQEYYYWCRCHSYWVSLPTVPRKRKYCFLVLLSGSVQSCPAIDKKDLTEPFSVSSLLVDCYSEIFFCISSVSFCSLPNFPLHSECKSGKLYS